MNFDLEKFKFFAMKKILSLILVVGILASCTTSNKIVTADDVYYSPTKEYREKKEYKVSDRNYSDRYYDEEERLIRMRAYDRRYRYLDYDYDYYDCHYSPYRYGYNYGYYYNPYYYPAPVYYYGYSTPSNPKNTTPRKINLGGYNNQVTTVSAPTKTGATTQPVIRTRVYNNSNNNSSRSETKVDRTYRYENNNSTRTYEPSNNSSRSYEPSSSGSSSGSSSSGSSSNSGSISRPGRGN